MFSDMISVVTTDGNAGGANCVFPYIYQGQQYWECIVRPAVSDYPWCATTGNYDADGLWGNCPRKISARVFVMLSLLKLFVHDPFQYKDPLLALGNSNCDDMDHAERNGINVIAMYSMRFSNWQ